MGQNSKIEWTDITWNPVTGCSKVSTGCKHCYAERLFPRVYSKDRIIIPTPADGITEETAIPPKEPTGHWTRPRKFTDVKLHPDRLEQPLHWKKPRMIFVNSMSDLFHEDVPVEFIEKIFDTMFLANQHTYQILTKRLKQAIKFFSSYSGIAENMTKPFLSHVWFGCSIEDQPTADERIPLLLQVPAAVRFLSCEPLLDRINLLETLNGCPVQISDEEWEQTVPSLDWVIVGGESGPGYRPMKPDWAKSIIEQCQAARVPVFMKQMAGKKAIPEDLMIREYPI